MIDSFHSSKKHAVHCGQNCSAKYKVFSNIFFYYGLKGL